MGANKTGRLKKNGRLADPGEDEVEGGLACVGRYRLSPRKKNGDDKKKLKVQRR